MKDPRFSNHLSRKKICRKHEYANSSRSSGLSFDSWLQGSQSKGTFWQTAASCSSAIAVALIRVGFPKSPLFQIQPEYFLIPIAVDMALLLLLMLVLIALIVYYAWSTVLSIPKSLAFHHPPPPTACPFLPMRKLRCREVGWLTQTYTGAQ